MSNNSYLNPLRGFFSHILDFNEKEWTILSNNLIYKEFKKGTILTHFNEVEKYTYIILEGYIRMFHLANGNDYTITYSGPMTALSNLESFITQKPSKLSLVTTTDIKVVLISHKKINSDYKHHYISEKLGRLSIEMGLINRIRKENKVFNNTAKERYLELQNTHPLLLKNITQKEIASYIGIAPESLSRIKKQINSENK